MAGIPRQRFKVQAPGISWICAQIGAREHYAIPRVLHRSGRLEALYTDYWSHGPWKVLGKLAGGARLAGRWHDELSDAEVYGFNATAILGGLRRRREGSGESYLSFLRIGSGFGKNARAAMSRRQEQNWSNTVFFGYDTGFLEAAAWAKDRGAACVVCQMDPARTEVDLVREEESRWPGWARVPLLVPDEYFAWRKAEWALADRVMVNSKWTRNALVQQGVAEEKIEIVPLAYEPEPWPQDSPPPLPKREEEPLRVLYLGQVNLRKGVQYLLEAARNLGKAVRIDIAGPIAISDKAVVSAPSNVKFHGAVTRDRVVDFYRAADVFVLPTISDGFALTQLEAMAHGLPVVTTPHCGEVVTDGVDGFLFPARDATALEKALLTLAEDPERLDAMKDAAKKAIERFGLDSLDRNLRALEAKLVTGRRS